MDAARWDQMQRIFHEAASVPRAMREPFVRSMCGDDDGLAADVMAMLEQNTSAVSMLDGTIASVADSVLGDGVSPPFVDQTFGPYRLTRLLGEGGMGSVYLGMRADLGSVAAIKILHDAWISPVRRERFAAEQRTLAQLNHPAIARLYDADTLPSGAPWLAMEYVDGTRVTDYCRERDASARERLQVFRRVCEPVEYAHRHMIVHRDLKPSNIFITRDGAVKLLDFGIARQIDAYDQRVDPTRTAVRLLTPNYAAPEQLRGEATTVQTDVYALGVILYELLAGRRPFDRSHLTPASAERQLMEDAPPRPSMIARETPSTPGFSRSAWRDLDVLILTAMHKDLSRRYRSVEALARDIDHFLANEPLEARPDTVGYRTSKFIRRNWRPVLAASVTAAVIVALTGFYTVRVTAARNAAIAQAARTNRIQRFMLRLFDGGEKDAGPADDLRVVTIIDRGEQEARTLDREPLVQAELYQTLGGVYEKLGKFDRAEALLRASLDERKAARPTSAPDVAKGMTALAQLRSDQARFDEAEWLAREALAFAQSTLRPGDPELGSAMAVLGQVLEQRGSYDEAISTLQQAVQLRSQPGADRSELADTLYELASTEFYAGHLDASEALNQRALAIHTELVGDAHPLVAEDLINLGAISHERGHYADAETQYRRALEINRRWYGDHSYRTASNLTMLGRSLYLEKRYDESRALLTQALSIQEEVFGRVHPRVASALNDLGNIAMSQERFDDAEQAFRRIGEIYRATYGDNHYLIGIATSNLAGVYMARRNFTTAETMYRNAIDIFSRTQSADHLNTGIARIKLGRALLKQGRTADAERESKAGYEIVSKRAAPSVSWLKSAREDLVAEYDTLHRPGDASRFRTEAARLAQTPTTR